MLNLTKLNFYDGTNKSNLIKNAFKSFLDFKIKNKRRV